ncbi:hypothetical protein BpHYR1_028477 [Brachionus plicatilis]|uniref:Uncharacterized protein n=1 Tax=Brachionus plicatilis TaxID=10195 RepID=A0A3M7RIT1_BRAPC|nr:hypothetical protein BpHYR1_028477 [Brachionus plicatilis]
MYQEAFNKLKLLTREKFQDRIESFCSTCRQSVYGQKNFSCLDINSQIPNLYRILKRKVLASGYIKEPKTYSISDLFFSFQSSNDVYNAPMDVTKKLNVELNKLSFNISNM